MPRWEVIPLVDMENFKKTLNSIKVLKTNPDFEVFMRHIRAMLEDSRIELETTKPDLIMLTQGRTSVLREVIGYIDGVNEIESKIDDVLKQGQLDEQSNP